MTSRDEQLFAKLAAKYLGERGGAARARQLREPIRARAREIREQLGLPADARIA